MPTMGLELIILRLRVPCSSDLARCPKREFLAPFLVSDSYSDIPKNLWRTALNVEHFVYGDKILDF